jgi:hypothetical protein
MVACAVLAAAGLTGCTGGPPRQAQSAATVVGRQVWVENASGVIDQLSGDVAAAEPAVPGLSAARRSLHDLSELYGLLVAYTDLGGCSKMVGGIGRPPPGFTGVLQTLEDACSGFERGAAFFTRAAADHDPRALVEAWSQVDTSQSVLYSAAIAFAAARSAAAGR